jgi:hypothetical protein
MKWINTQPLMTVLSLIILNGVRLGGADLIETKLIIKQSSKELLFAHDTDGVILAKDPDDDLAEQTEPSARNAVLNRPKPVLHLCMGHVLFFDRETGLLKFGTAHSKDVVVTPQLNKRVFKVKDSTNSEVYLHTPRRNYLLERKKYIEVLFTFQRVSLPSAYARIGTQWCKFVHLFSECTSDSENS